MHLPLYLLVADAAAGDAGGAGLLSFAPLLLILVMFWFLLMRPQKAQEKQRLAMIAALKRNDKVVNSGGIIGVVESVKDDDEVVLKGGLRVTKSSIVRVIPPEDSPKDQKEGGG